MSRCVARNGIVKREIVLVVIWSGSRSQTHVPTVSMLRLRERTESEGIIDLLTGEGEEDEAATEGEVSKWHWQAKW